MVRDFMLPILIQEAKHPICSHRRHRNHHQKKGRQVLPELDVAVERLPVINLSESSHG